MNKRLRPHPLYPAAIAWLAPTLSLRAQNDDASNEHRLSLFWLSQNHPGSGIQSNTFRLNIRIATSKGILWRVLGWSGHAE
jgi:hypothetical protein